MKHGRGRLNKNMFNISDKVVYVGGNGGPVGVAAEFDYTEDNLILNSVYVVSKILPCPQHNAIGLAFVGHTSYCKNDGAEVGYDSRMFRKLEEIQAENKAKNERFVYNAS